MASTTSSGSSSTAGFGRPAAFDAWLLVTAGGLLLVGLMAQYSVSEGRGLGTFPRQLAFAGIGLIPFAFFYWVSPSFLRRAAPVLYVLALALLASVLVFGETVLGARRWIEIGPMQFQPSEPAKLLLTITLAAFYSMRLDRIREFSTFGLSILHMAVPMGLVFKQPHLGGALVLTVIWLSVSLAAGVRMRFLAMAVAAVPLLLTVAWFTPGVLTAEQKDRVHGLLGGDSQDSAYQATRASIAFGVGGVTGTGFLRGKQIRGRFIPMQQNDFVFTVLGEEAGLVGCLLVLGLFGAFLFRIWLVMFQADEPFHKMIAGGILGMLAFHTLANLGMVLQLLPVVGLWLPFLSAGGTALWLCMACVGLLLNLRRREKPLLF